MGRKVSIKGAGGGLLGALTPHRVVSYPRCAEDSSQHQAHTIGALIGE